MNKKINSYLDLLKKGLLDDDVKSYADVSSLNLSEASHKANVLPGHIVDVDNLFTPVFTSYELLPVKRLFTFLELLITICGHTTKNSLNLKN